MRNSRKVIESGILTAVLAIAAAATAVSGNVTDTSQSSQQEKEETVFMAKRAVTASAKELTAVADLRNESNAVQAVDAHVQSAATEHFMVEVHDTEIQGYVNVAEGSAVSTIDKKSSVDEQLNSAQQEEQQNEEASASEWDSKLMANVEDNLNVRMDASEESEVVGKLYKGAAADIEEVGDEWTKISSGNVEGYVKNEFCVSGEDAKALAEEICKTYATASTDGLRVRAEASTDAEILTMLTKDQKLTVDTEAEAPEGWIAVECLGRTAFLSADYAEVSMDIGTAMTLEEEQEMIEAQEAAKREAQAKAAAQTSQSSASVSTDSGISSSVDDVTLLAALIYCEAGGESYEGQLAVGAVVVNRVQSSAYPDSISAVIYQKGQFTPASSGKLARALANGSGKSCMKAAQEALSGVDNTGGALGFHAGKGSGTVIGNQTFY